ncbi:MAG: hypothetical protein IJJ44_00340 [Solobacterium sp.]|nr:hypothetical protein [Solobacterium sp.]
METLTKRERFERFMANEPVDRVPVAFFHHFIGQDQWFKGMVDEQAFEKNIEGHRIARKIFDPDIIKVMNDSLMIMPVDMTFVKHAQDLEKIEPPVHGSLFFEKSKELTKRVLEIYADSDAPTYFTGFSCGMIAKLALRKAPVEEQPGKSKLQVLIEEDKEAVVKALTKINDSVIALNKEIFEETGVEGLYFSVNNQAHYLPDDMFREIIAPLDKKVIEEANKLSKINMLHICGYEGLSNNLELFTDYDTPIINWAVHAEGVSLSEGKKLFHGKPICGGFAQAETIYKGSPRDVENETFRYLKDAGQVGVMIGADCTVPMDIDNERLEWVRRACMRFATLPNK